MITVRVPPRRSCAFAILSAAGLAVALLACDEATPALGIASVRPEPITPGKVLEVHGRGFGGAPAPFDGVSIGGRPLTVRDWSDRRIRAAAPPDLPRGASFLVATTRGRTLAPFPVQVGGRGRHPGGDAPELGRPIADAGRLDTGPGTPDSAFPEPALPDATLGGAEAELVPDPVDGPHLGLSTEPAPPGELRLRITVEGAQPPAGPAPEEGGTGPVAGVAFHLTFDPNLLRFISAAPEADLDPRRALLWRELERGRLAVGARVRGDTPVVLTVRFALIGLGEGRIELPERFASARDAENRPLVVWTWAGAMVRSREVGP